MLPHARLQQPRELRNDREELKGRLHGARQRVVPAKPVDFCITITTIKPRTDEQFFLDKFYFLVCTAKNCQVFLDEEPG